MLQYQDDLQLLGELLTSVLLQIKALNSLKHIKQHGQLHLEKKPTLCLYTFI